MKKTFTLTVLYFLPVIVFGFSLSSSTFIDVIDQIMMSINIAIPLLFSLSFIVFFWGVSKFILNSGSATEVQKGKSYMIWGVAALFVLVTVRAIISIVVKDLDMGDAKVLPLIPTEQSANYSNNDFGLPQSLPKP